MRRSPYLLGGVALVLWGAGLAAQSGQVNRRAATLVDFGKRIQEYLDVRQKAVSAFEALKPDADQAAIATREKALGEAIRTARTGAKAGDLFTKEVAPLFRTETKADFARRSTHGKKLRLDELPHFEPIVNQTYPSTWPLQTFPPSLLAALPKLPPELEYRFVDNALILRDTKANLVVDFLRDVM
jgi:hypothetical protein